MSSLLPNPTVPAPIRGGAKLVGSFFFLFFLSLGCWFVVLVGREAMAGLRTYGWAPTDCEIVRSEVRPTDPRGQNTGDFYFDVEYRYVFNGRAFTSARHRLRSAAFNDYRKAQRLVETYRTGTHSVCYVDPVAPGNVVLERGSLVFPLLVLFPLIFVAIGAGGIYAIWRPGNPSRVRPISDHAAGVFGQRFATLFFTLFVAVGCLLFFLVSAGPLTRVVSSRTWPSVPCSVVLSQVKSHRGNHGNTYSVNVLYSYVFQGRPYKSNQYDFMGGSSSGFSAKQTIVSRYAPGSEHVCYVNPADPTEAVLVRGFTPMMCIGLLPLLFVVVGAIGLVSNLVKARRGLVSPDGAVGSFAVEDGVVPVVPQGSAPPNRAPLRLRPSASPLKKLFGSIFLALFWNGMVSVFLGQLLKNWRAGHFEWFLGLFLCPFVLVGLGLIVAVGYFLLGLFNPRAHLTVTPGAVALGDSLRVEWDLTGRVEVLQNLRLGVEGREEATYTRGTRSYTDRSVFAELELAAVTQPQAMRSGSGTLTIPAGLMHSFASRHNKIVWVIRVHGDIPHWPDLDEEFPVAVLPATSDLANQT